MYSGRQFQLVIPLVDEGSPILVSGVLARVRSQWPEEFSEMKEQAASYPVKMLKTGELLSQSSPFSQYLSKSDLATAVDDASKLPADGEKSPVIIHLVFQQNTVPSPVKAPERAAPATRVPRDNTDDRPQSSGGCCTIM